MRQIEINTFNQFLTEAGIRDEYMAQFTNSRDEKTDSIDDFMLSVKPSDVFTDGFNTELVSDNEWQAAKNLWKEYMDEHLPSKPTYKFCLSCWQLMPIDSFQANPLEKDGHALYCKDCITPQHWISTHSNKKPEGCMSKHECILFNDHIYLNMELSQLIREKGFKHCGLRHQDGKLFFIFCEKSKDKNLKYTKTGGVSIISQSLVDDVVKTMNANFTDPMHLRITTNKSLKPSAVTIEVLQCVSHEEYMKNPFARKKKEEEKKAAKAVTADKNKKTKDVATDLSPDWRSCITGYKFCISCCRPKPVSDFYADSKTPDGYGRICRICSSPLPRPNQNTIPHHTAILFGNQVFFDEKISKAIREASFHGCYFIEQFLFQSNHLQFSINHPEKGNNASMFTSCNGSGVTALKEINIVNSIRKSLGLKDSHAYILKLSYGKISYDDSFTINIQSAFPYHFRESTEENQDNQPVEVQSASGQEIAGDSYDDIKKTITNEFIDYVIYEEITKELEDSVIREHVPSNAKSSIDATILWIIRQMKKVWNSPNQTDNDKPMDTSANSDPFKDVMRYLISNDPAQGLAAKFIKHHDNPDYKEGIVALEETFANALKAVGWKLQRPVKVVHYEEF